MKSFSKQNIFTNVIWRFLERTGSQLVALIVSIVLARLLTPGDYGVIALLLVFINILNVFVDSGLGTALVQKKDSDDIDFSTVFFTNVIFCILLYSLVFFTAPLIAKFYRNDELVPLIRVLSITILVSGLKNVQQAYVSKTLQFKKFFFATLIGTITAACVGIWMAYHNLGVWALVAQQITNLVIDTLLLWVFVKWRPLFVFSFSRLKTLFSFGWKLLVSALLDTGFNNLRQLIIGKKYSPEDLAFYTKGELFPYAIAGNLTNAIDSVVFPTMSLEQDNIEKLKSMTRRAIKISTYCIAPLMMGLAACAPGFIHILLTDKWMPSVLFLRIFCITYIFWPVHTANLNAIKALGRSDLFLKLEIIKKVVGTIVVLIAMWFGVEVMAYSLFVTSLFSQIINSWPNKKLLNYGYLEQVKDILPGLLLASVMSLTIGLINFIPISYTLKILIQIPSGIIFYIIGSKIFKLDSYEYLLSILKEKFIRG